MRRERLSFYVCKESIYQYIYSKNGTKDNLYRLLPKKKRTSVYKRPSRGGIPYATPIHQRPKSIEARKFFGHWEGDLVMFGINRNGNITTLVEQKSRYSLLIHNTRKYTDVVIPNIVKTIVKLQSHSNMNIVKSITFDRGTEFAHHTKINMISVKTFFCDPCAPYQKGGNENFNGRLRRFFPKSSYTTKITQQNLDLVQNIMNNTPRKCLGFNTPAEAFSHHLTQQNSRRCITN